LCADADGEVFLIPGSLDDTFPTSHHRRLLVKRTEDEVTGDFADQFDITSLRGDGDGAGVDGEQDVFTEEEDPSSNEMGGSNMDASDGTADVDPPEEDGDYPAGAEDTYDFPETELGGEVVPASMTTGDSTPFPGIIPPAASPLPAVTLTPGGPPRSGNGAHPLFSTIFSCERTTGHHS
jgi:hypothetical protein